MIFSNNMKYDDSSSLPIEGAFYATASYQKPGFNYFREEEKFDLAKILSDVPDEIETAILKDTNLVGINIRMNLSPIKTLIPALIEFALHYFNVNVYLFYCNMDWRMLKKKMDFKNILYVLRKCLQLNPK